MVSNDYCLLLKTTSGWEASFLHQKYIIFLCCNLPLGQKNMHIRLNDYIKPFDCLSTKKKKKFYPLIDIYYFYTSWYTWPVTNISVIKSYWITFFMTLYLDWYHLFYYYCIYKILDTFITQNGRIFMYEVWLKRLVKWLNFSRLFCANQLYLNFRTVEICMSLCLIAYQSSKVI